VRDHPIFQGPVPVSTNNFVRRPASDVFRKKSGADYVMVLSLVKNPEQERDLGYISYREQIDDSPEVEIVCGGLNDREVEGAAMWRQGHLFHFAFDLSPAEMNEFGQALLLNSIAYIARFSEDRPIARTPSGWNGKDDSPRFRSWVKKLFDKSQPSKDDLGHYFTSATVSIVADMDKALYSKWHKENADFLTCDFTGKLMVDATAKEIGILFDKPEFFPKAVELLKTAATAAKAQQLLARYAPMGPADGSAGEWEKWWLENRSYLFFTVKGGYRWHIDPLAKSRGIPSEKLRGPARGSVH
jgi:hypothetical protein